MSQDNSIYNGTPISYEDYVGMVIAMDETLKAFVDEIDEEEDASYWQNRIAIDPSILVGMPAIKGTRIGVDIILDLLAWGWSESDILENYPGITHEDIRACLSYASAALRRSLSKKCQVQ